MWYWPTFVVINQNKQPPKRRLVYDAAARVNGQSLNTNLVKDPDYLTPLTKAITRFREKEIACTGDVKDMFHCIRICKEDQPCQRFLWHHGKQDQEPTTYILQVMAFGPSCSPCASQAVKNHHARKYENSHPAAADAIINSTYMDDYLASHASLSEAVTTNADAIRILGEISFELRGFQSNSLELLKTLPQENVHTSLVAMTPDLEDPYTSKILGLFWNPSTDCFSYKVDDSQIHRTHKKTIAEHNHEDLRPIKARVEYTDRGKNCSAKRLAKRLQLGRSNIRHNPTRLGTLAHPCATNNQLKNSTMVRSCQPD